MESVDLIVVRQSECVDACTGMCVCGYIGTQTMVKIGGLVERTGMLLPEGFYMPWRGDFIQCGYIHGRHDTYNRRHIIQQLRDTTYRRQGVSRHKNTISHDRRPGQNEVMKSSPAFGTGFNTAADPWATSAAGMDACG